MRYVDHPSVALAASIRAELARRAAAADRAAALPEEDVALLKRHRFFALSVPTELGGHGLTLAEAVAAIGTLAQGSAATAIVAAMPTQVFGHEREVRAWRPAQFAAFGQAAAAGGLFNALASEPALGSPSRGGLPQTTAVSTADQTGWRINGRKTWSTGGRFLTHLLVRAAVESEPGVVLVPGDAAGICWDETWQDALSLRASDSHDVIFEDVVVPREHLVERGAGPAQPNVWFPLLMPAVYLGAAVAARNAVIQYALERVPTALGKPIATLPKIQRQIGELDVALQTAEALLFEVASEWRGQDGNRERFLPRIAAAKSVATDVACRVTDQALRIAGGSSLTAALPLERHFRDVRAGHMQPPSGDTAFELVGRAAVAARKA